MAALIHIEIAAAPFIHGRGMGKAREQLASAMSNGRRAMRAADTENIKPDYPSLRDLADSADTEPRERPGFRTNLDG